MGGCVWVESEEGVGSRFALTLPMTVAPRSRNYSNDSTPLGYVGSPSSPSSTISDSSGSVQSSAGNISDNNSPLYTFTTPVASNPSYFPTMNYGQSNNNNTVLQQQQQHQQRPMLPRTTHQQLFSNEMYNNRPEPSISLALQTSNDPHFSPMSEDIPPVSSSSSGIDSIKRVTQNVTHNLGGGISLNVGNNGTARKTYNDLLSPASRNTRVAITKQHYHNRKPQTKEENLAKIHPLRILLAEDNICKSLPPCFVYLHVLIIILSFFFYIVNQKIAISILKRLGYIDVAIANNGKEVLSLMKTSVFDVIFVSILIYKKKKSKLTKIY